MNDTTRKFLNSVLERVGETRVVDVRLFPAIRQGGIESGLAVLAVQPAPAPVADVVEALEFVEADATDDVQLATGDVEVIIEHPADDIEVQDELIEVDAAALHHLADAPMADLMDEAEEALNDAERETIREVSSEGVAAAEPAVIADVEVALEYEATDLADAGADAFDSPVLADEASPYADETIALGDILALPSPESAEVPETGHRRLEILCARYKLVFKGPDRGKWDVEIMHQADAPLETLEKVIAGVVRRSGEESEPERYSRESLRTSLDAPPWAQSA